jgi:hypothetical protein
MVVVVVVLVFVVVVLAQPVAVHASQQLRKFPLHARPPLGLLHALALAFTAHFVLPLAVVMQQVTLPGLAQVDFAAHLAIGAAHAAGRLRFLTAAWAWCETHLTYCP